MNDLATKAERRDRLRLERQALQQQEQRRADIPAVFRVDQGSAARLTGLGDPQITGLRTVDQARAHRRLQTESSHAIARTGRPSDYTDEEADSVCAWVQEGGSLRGYCKATGRQSKSLYGWMRERADFFARYTRACEDRADTLSDEIIEIVDGCAVEPTLAGVAAAKLRVEARKWIASKLRPQKWGDRQVVEHAGAVSIRIGIAPSPKTAGEVLNAESLLSQAL